MSRHPSTARCAQGAGARDAPRPPTSAGRPDRLDGVSFDRSHGGGAAAAREQGRHPRGEQGAAIRPALDRILSLRSCCLTSRPLYRTGAPHHRKRESGDSARSGPAPACAAASRKLGERWGVGPLGRSAREAGWLRQWLLTIRTDGLNGEQASQYKALTAWPYPDLARLTRPLRMHACQDGDEGTCTQRRPCTQLSEASIRARARA